MPCKWELGWSWGCVCVLVWGVAVVIANVPSRKPIMKCLECSWVKKNTSLLWTRVITSNGDNFFILLLYHSCYHTQHFLPRRSTFDWTYDTAIMFTWCFVLFVSSEFFVDEHPILNNNYYYILHKWAVKIVWTVSTRPKTQVKSHRRSRFKRRLHPRNSQRRPTLHPCHRPLLTPTCHPTRRHPISSLRRTFRCQRRSLRW